MTGACTIQITPRIASTVNHSAITGPNSRPIFAVPRLCSTNSPIRMISASGRISGSRTGEPMPTPSTADSTEIAGVSMPSP